MLHKDEKVSGPQNMMKREFISQKRYITITLVTTIDCISCKIRRSAVSGSKLVEDMRDIIEVFVLLTQAVNLVVLLQDLSGQHLLFLSQEWKMFLEYGNDVRCLLKTLR